MENIFKKFLEKTGVIETVEQKRKKFEEKEINSHMRAWLGKEKGISRKPTPEELAAILNEAEVDGFEGGVGIKTTEQSERIMYYRNSKDIKWASEFSGGGTGGMGTGVSK